MLNGSDSPFLDRFMWLYSGKAVWLPLAFFILVVLLYKKKWRESILILLAIVLVITLCDQFASHVCKPIFTRFRPTHHPDFMDQVKTLSLITGAADTVLFPAMLLMLSVLRPLCHCCSVTGCLHGRSSFGLLLPLIPVYIWGSISFRILFPERSQEYSLAGWYIGYMSESVR